MSVAVSQRELATRSISSRKARTSDSIRSRIILTAFSFSKLAAWAIGDTADMNTIDGKKQDGIIMSSVGTCVVVLQPASCWFCCTLLPLQRSNGKWGKDSVLPKSI